MLSTEVISIPTGFIFLCGMATLWRARIRYTVPMLFCLAFFFNFFIGGVSGFFLSDTPSDVSTHGSFFVMAHFHYTIMGGLIFAFFAAIYYWIPKMTGLRFNERLAKIHFWVMFIAFNSTFGPLFALGLMGHAATSRHLRLESAGAEHLGVGLRVRARRLDARLPRQRPLLAGHRSQAVGGEPVGLEIAWSGSSRRPSRCTTSTAFPSFDSDPYDYGVPPAPPRPVPAGATGVAPYPERK